MKETFRSFSDEFDHHRFQSPKKTKHQIFSPKKRRSPVNVKSSRSFFDIITSKDELYDDQHVVRPYCQACKFQKADYYNKRGRVYMCDDCAYDQMRYGGADFVDLRQQGYSNPAYNYQVLRPKSARNLFNPQKHFRWDWDKGYDQKFYDKYHRKHESVKVFEKLDIYENMLKAWLFQKRTHDDTMKTFMKNARSLLKEHYQKINQLLTQCWKQDDQALKILQQKQAQMFKNNKKIIQQQLQALKKIQIQFQYTTDGFFKNISQLKYNNILEQIKKNIPKIVSIGGWIKKDIKKTPQELFINQRNPKILLPETYRIINQKIQIESMHSNDKNNRQMLFSFDRF